MSLREIKFRAWDKKGEKMINWPDMVWVELGDLNNMQTMQYTGLKDKNDKEIYEGDIVHFTVFYRFCDDKQYKGVVKFAEGQWQIWNSAESEFYGSDGAFNLWWVNQQDGEFEIIGNIYENPELLEATA